MVKFSFIMGIVIIAVLINKYNNLGKLCLACVVVNLIMAWIMATNGNMMAVFNISSAFLCHLGSFSKKCRKQNVEL